ncbi:diphosphomevalonate decarboxylase [Candidatus Woesebacteria bacterium]|nr:diphosphomevalonate decarboxylase [Candidatus Woesebacteria bacterium]
MKATAIAPANIAFIKYWGKADSALRLPLNDSISMNLSGAYTTTTVEFSSAFSADSVELLEGEFSHKEIARVVAGLDRIRQISGIRERARVVTENSFPKGAGSAASASGFAALTAAGFAATEMVLSEKDLTVVARLGSGSACRSIPDGFVLWQKGNTPDDSFAYSLHPKSHWDLCDALIIVDSRMKKISTSDGMETVSTSPLLAGRLAAIPERIIRCKLALKDKNFTQLGEVMEEDCLDMHAVMQSQNPPCMYWNETTVAIMDAIKIWRSEGLPVYFTIDAGPNVHVIYEAIHEHEVAQKLATLSGVEKIIYNNVSSGAQRIDKHLF